MLAAVQLDHQPRIEAGEIDDVIPDRGLATELPPVEPMGPEFVPEATLGVGQSKGLHKSIKHCAACITTRLWNLNAGFKTPPDGCVE